MNIGYAELKVRGQLMVIRVLKRMMFQSATTGWHAARFHASE